MCVSILEIVLMFFSIVNQEYKLTLYVILVKQMLFSGNTMA